MRIASPIRRRNRRAEIARAITVFVFIQVLAACGVRTASAQSKLRRRNVIGQWQYNVKDVNEPHEIRLVNTLTLRADGKGNWSLVPTNRTHKASAFKLTWFIIGRIVAVSLSQATNATLAERSNDTMYGQITADQKTLILTVEHGRVERYERVTAR